MPPHRFEQSRVRALVATASYTAFAGTLAGFAGVPFGAAPAVAQDAASDAPPIAVGPTGPSTDPAPEPPAGGPAPEPPPDLPVPAPKLPRLPLADAPTDVPADVPTIEVRSGYAVAGTPPARTELPLAPPAGAPLPPSASQPGASPRDAKPPARAPSSPRGGRRPRRAAEPDTSGRTPRGVTPRPPATPEPAAIPPVPTEHTIAPGEHLWSIAAAHLAQMTGRPTSALTAPEIAGYWTRLCMVNHARLQSGDPNLVYPGEVLELPPL